MRTLYIHRLENNTCLTHDGYIQLGTMNHSVEDHIRLNSKMNWVETYWAPDVFTKRPKRASFVSHMRVSGGKDAIESRPRDFPDEGAARGLLNAQELVPQ